jgi:membrane protease YdiL (CAAX protease family)
VLPADPFQLLFLTGIICLVIAHGSRWWPRLGPFNSLGVLPIVFAGAAGYFVCFWPGNHPIRRILVLILLPVVIGLGSLIICPDHFAGPARSVLDSAGSIVAHQVPWAQTMLWKAPQGVQFTLVGLLLIAIFVSRLAFGVASLPLSLPAKYVSQPEDPEFSRRLNLLIWFLVSLTFLAGGLLSLVTFGVPFTLTSRVPPYVYSEWFTRLSSIIQGALVLGIALSIVGKDGRATIRRSIRLPDVRWPLLALAFPIGIDILISAGQYAFDRVQWSTHGFGTLYRPQLALYFKVPEIWWLLVLFVAAFFEEVIFRGLLQTRFILRYGMYRGVFLVGIVWAAFHFYSDFSFRHFTYQEAIFQLCFRLFLCTALNFVLSWLTLRSESIVPASIAHALFNAFVFSPIGPSFAGKEVLRIALWATLAYVLFRYWPISPVTGLERVTKAESPERTGESTGGVCDEGV